MAQTTKPVKQQPEKVSVDPPKKGSILASSVKLKPTIKATSENEQNGPKNKVQSIEESEDLEATSELVTSAQETDQNQKSKASPSKTAKDLTKKISSSTKKLKTQTKEFYGKITGKKKAEETDKQAITNEEDKAVDLAATIPGRKSKKRQGRQLIQKND